MILPRISLIVCMLAAPALAQPILLSAQIRGDVGYATNPFLQDGVKQGTASGALTISPRLSYATARSNTVLDASYNRYQYFKRFGNTDTLTSNLQRTDQITEYLLSALTASYSTSNQALVYDAKSPLIDDPLNYGRRTRTLRGGEQLQWQPTARDRFTIGGSVEHQSYGGGRGALPGTVASSYTQYAIDGGYDRVIDARTSVGVQVVASQSRSRRYPDSRVIQPSLTAKRQLSAIWTVDGHIGLFIDKTDGQFGSTNTTLGFGLNACGKYPRTRLCITGDRQKAPSGYGGLRTITNVSATLDHDLSEHSRLSFSANYYETGADDLAALSTVDSSRALLFSGEYDRDVSRRLSAGFGGNYQWRKTSGFGTARAVTASAHLTAKLGRL